ncbi:hypothetical protein ACFL1H_08165 [Nanoarchaeota archaeon]
MTFDFWSDRLEKMVRNLLMVCNHTNDYIRNRHRPKSYEIFKDHLNNYHFRLIQKEIILVKRALWQIFKEKNDPEIIRKFHELGTINSELFGGEMFSLRGKLKQNNLSGIIILVNKVHNFIYYLKKIMPEEYNINLPKVKLIKIPKGQFSRAA